MHSPNWLAGALVLLIWTSSLLGGIPIKPETGARIHDFAQIISDGDKQTLEKMLEQTMQESGVPIVVVTIRRMKDFDQDSTDIESFTRLWFKSWELGAPKNNGMLVLVSTEDRRARIGLGSA